MLANILILLMILEASDELVIQVKHGPVKGRIIYAGQHAVLSFKNIPYAEPPIGNLRFELPKEHNGWFSEDDMPDLYDIRCPQHSFFADEENFDTSLGQEDCLYLDVYTRQEHDELNMSLPVVVYFHGGLFQSGSKEDYGPDFLLRFNDIILVVPNYRLGILGFLNFNDAALPGNLGLWDQNAALKWVSENIGYFGGDPQRVTISGHEAGAASVGLHILSPASNDYFQGALSGSGSALSPWLIDVDPSPSAANEVANLLQCPESSPNNLLICLKTAPLQEIMKVQGIMKNTVFLPTIDNQAETSFIPYPPTTLYERGYHKNVNYVIGFTEHEGSYDVANEFPKVLKYKHLDKMIHHFLQPHFRNNLNINTIVKAAKYHYLSGIMIPTFESIEPQIAKMMTDFLYRSPLEQVVRLHFQKPSDIFVYIFEGKEKVCSLENRRCYGNENYIFNISLQEETVELYPDIWKTTETLSKLWGHFIRFGYPDVHKIWQPVQDVDDLSFAEISDLVQPKSNFRNDDNEFWITLVSELNAAKNWSEVSSSDVLLAPDYSTLGIRGAAAMAVLFGVLCVALVGLVVVTKRRTLIWSIVPSVVSERR